MYKIKLWSRNVSGLVNLFLKSNCPLCQRPTTQEFCLDCTRQIKSCQLKHPDFNWRNSLPVFAWGRYGDALKRSLTSMKYNQHPQIARPLGMWLGEAWLNSSYSYQEVIVIPIPLHPSRQKERGFNQAALIANSFCDVTGLKLKQNGLVRIKATAAQFRLSPAERNQNLSDAFELGTDLQHHPHLPVLLVDDIYTTGATAKSAVQTLRNQGVSVYGLVTVAMTTKNS